MSNILRKLRHAYALLRMRWVFGPFPQKGF